ncbi:MAG: acyl-CoA dehydrogenase family protein, partial [Nakamurella sp.]
MTDFAEPAEYADLRAAIREITLAHGPAEYAEHGRTSTPMTALWADLGKAGFIGINVPAEFGGGGAGMAELAMVAEESAAAGCPLLTLLVSSAIGVEVLRRHGSAQ